MNVAQGSGAIVMPAFFCKNLRRFELGPCEEELPELDFPNQGSLFAVDLRELSRNFSEGGSDRCHGEIRAHIRTSKNDKQNTSRKAMRIAAFQARKRKRAPGPQ